MSVTVNNLSGPSLMPIKKDDAADWFHCQFCALMFTTYDEYKTHTYRHFKTKACSVCYVLLIQICDDEWFCLHTTSNCETVAHSHTFTDDDRCRLPLSAIKQELIHPYIEFNVDETHTSSNFQSEDNGWNDEDELVEDLMVPKKCNRTDRKGFPSSRKSALPCTCPKCGRSYSNRSNLTKHLKRHEKANLNVPEQKKYENDSSFKDRLKHNDSVAFNVGSDVSRKKHQTKDISTRVHPHRPSKVTCGYCQKKFSFSWLKEHMQLQHAAKTKQIFNKKRPKHICSFCGRQFNDRSNMRSHEKTHFGIKTPCNVCGKQFSITTDLRKHMKVVHEKARPHSCNVGGCEWTFGTSGALKRHQARRHGMVTNRNACPICSKEFPDSPYHLKRHLTAHANNTAKEYVPPSKVQSAASKDLK